MRNHILSTIGYIIGVCLFFGMMVGLRMYLPEKTITLSYTEAKWLAVFLILFIAVSLKIIAETKY